MTKYAVKLLIGAGIIGAGMAGALAVADNQTQTVAPDQQTVGPAGQKNQSQTNSNKAEVGPAANQSQEAAEQVQVLETLPQQEQAPITVPQQEQAPITVPQITATNGQVVIQSQNQVQQNAGATITQETKLVETSKSHQHLGKDTSLCAPEALKVGIKHFKYADAKSSDLVWSGYGSQGEAKYKIHREAKAALNDMVKAARADGVTLSPGSIFRGSARQAQIVNGKKAKGQSAKQIYYTSSHPGYSEHHTGLAVDFLPINSGFAKTAGYRWLKQHAKEYGFYQTFTPEYSAYSGVSEESWHWRFEGKNGEYAHIFADSKNRRC